MHIGINTYVCMCIGVYVCFMCFCIKLISTLLYLFYSDAKTIQNKNKIKINENHAHVCLGQIYVCIQYSIHMYYICTYISLFCQFGSTTDNLCRLEFLFHFTCLCTHMYTFAYSLLLLIVFIKN